MSEVNNYRIIFFGTSEFAVPALEALQATSYQLQAVITQPDKPKGRKQEISPSPVKVLALKLKLPVLQYESLKKENAISEIKALGSDVAVVASYGKIIPQELLTAFPKGCVNLHPSLLPRYRGPSPIQTALLNGDITTGVSLMLLDAELDHGPLLAQKKVKILRNDTYQTLHDRLASQSSELLIKTLPKYLKSQVTIKPQDHKKATFTKLLTREDGRIDWKKSAGEIFNQIRAFNPWPGTWTTFKGKRLKILKAGPIKALKQKLQPGEVYQAEKKLIVGCGIESVLEVNQLQLEGKKATSAVEFIKGNAINGLYFG